MVRDCLRDRVVCTHTVKESMSIIINFDGEGYRNIEIDTINTIW